MNPIPKKDFFRTFGPFNLGTTAIIDVPYAFSNAKKYTTMQRSARKPLVTKTASRLKKPLEFGAAALTVPKALGIGMSLSLGGLGAYQIGKGVGNTYQKFQANRMFVILQNRYPEIRRNKKSREYFDLIIAYAPSLLRHPTAIGDFLTRQLEYPMSSIEFIKQLADLEGTIAKTDTYSAASNFGKQTVQSGSMLMKPMTVGE